MVERDAIEFLNSVITVTAKFINKCEEGKARSKEMLHDLLIINKDAITLKSKLEYKLGIKPESFLDEDEHFRKNYCGEFPQHINEDEQRRNREISAESEQAENEKSMGIF